MGPGIRLETKEFSNMNKETDNNPSYKARVYVCINIDILSDTKIIKSNSKLNFSL